MSTTADVIIVGAGLAGLSAARHLHRSGRAVLVVDRSDDVGGRVRTDRVDGCLLDRGFQVFLEAYPEPRRVLEYASLGLHAFEPGALVRADGGFHRVVDPWRRPLGALGMLGSPVGSFADKLRVARLRSRVRAGSLDEALADPETTTLEALRASGLSPSMIERFFRPFLGGVFLEPGLQTSSRMFRFVFRMFSEGPASLPAEGMQAIPRQLAAGLPRDAVRLGARVSRVEPGVVALASGAAIEAPAVILATDAPHAAGLLGTGTAPRGQDVTCLYFLADRPPVDVPMLVLDGEHRGPVNNLSVPNLVAPSYAPSGRFLISASVLGLPAASDAALRRDVLDQMAGWFGDEVTRWKPLRTYRIEEALPDQTPPALSPLERPVRLAPGLYACGDYLDTASIHGAMVSGRRAAQAVLEDTPAGERRR